MTCFGRMQSNWQEGCSTVNEVGLTMSPDRLSNGCENELHQASTLTHRPALSHPCPSPHLFSLVHTMGHRSQGHRSHGQLSEGEAMPADFYDAFYGENIMHTLLVSCVLTLSQTLTPFRVASRPAPGRFAWGPAQHGMCSWCDSNNTRFASLPSRCRWSRTPLQHARLTRPSS
jgi:hypothetical protein